MARPAHSSLVRYALGGLLAFIALNAFGGGYYGMTGAPEVPREWLAGTPFRNYAVPSLILFVVVGGWMMVSATAVFARSELARQFATAAGVIVLGWIAAQVAIIGYVSWMQPVTALAGVTVLVLASRLAPAPDDQDAGYSSRSSV